MARKAKPQVLETLNQGSRSQLEKGKTMRVSGIVRFLCVAGVVLMGAALGVQAVTVDLTTGVGAQGTINNAIYMVPQPDGAAGSGVLDSFVRINPGGNATQEQGYNTSGRPLPFDENSSPTFTHNLQISDLQTTTLNGTPYYGFVLDINEPQGQDREFLLLDNVQLYTSPAGSIKSSTLSDLGALRYTMDNGGDSTVLLDSSIIGSGSGRADMQLLIPVSNLNGAASSDYVYLYSRFGGVGEVGLDDSTQDFGANGGYEERAQRGEVGMIPEPVTMLLVGLGVAAVGSRVRRRLR
jgi:hypothetical protein